MFRPRTLIYLGVWSAIGAAMLFMLGQRARLDISVAKDRNPEFVMLSDGTVRNAWTIKLRNMEERPRTFRVALDGLEGAAMFTDEMDAAAAKRELTFRVPADTTRRLRIYVIDRRRAEHDEHHREHGEGHRERGHGEFSFVLTAPDDEGGMDRSETSFTLPEGGGE